MDSLFKDNYLHTYLLTQYRYIHTYIHVDYKDELLEYECNYLFWSYHEVTLHTLLTEQTYPQFCYKMLSSLPS